MKMLEGLANFFTVVSGVVSTLSLIGILRIPTDANSLVINESNLKWILGTSLFIMIILLFVNKKSVMKKISYFKSQIQFGGSNNTQNMN